MPGSGNLDISASQLLKYKGYHSGGQVEMNQTYKSGVCWPCMPLAEFCNSGRCSTGRMAMKDMEQGVWE